MKTLEDVLRELPPELRKEVEDFARFLLERRRATGGRAVGQSWAGALSDDRDRFTALELQRKALEWRGD